MIVAFTALILSTVTALDVPLGWARHPAHVPTTHPIDFSICVKQRNVPTLLQEALQHDVPYPQLITERSPPFKTIHVNAAWCRQCGYRADEIIGRPYSLLLGPTGMRSLPPGKPPMWRLPARASFTN